MHTGAAKTHIFATSEVLVLLPLALALQFTDVLLIKDHITSMYRVYYYSIATYSFFLLKSRPTCRARSTLGPYNFILLGLMAFCYDFSF